MNKNPSEKEIRLWVLNLVCGLIVFVVLGVHMGIMHLDDVLHAVFGIRAAPLEWQNVLARGRSVGFTATYVLALGAALYHGLYGVRTMLLEYFPTPRACRVITGLCWFIGVGLFVLGTTATLLFHVGPPS